MTPEFYVLLLSIIVVLSWHMTMHALQSRGGSIILARTTTDAKRQFSHRYQIPESHAIVYKHNGRQKTPMDAWILSGQWSVGARPVTGDHIHMAISFWIHGTPRDHAEHDREPIETLGYEKPFGKDSRVCKVSGEVSYHKLWPHVGVHTHCDGLIHVHPWSAPRTLRREGIDVQLGLWFDQVGIDYREYPVSLKFNDGSRYDSNDTHRWHVAEKTCYKNNIDRVYTNHLDSIWLGHAYASYIAWFGKIGSAAPPDISLHVNRLESVGVHGAFDRPYPQTCH